MGKINESHYERMLSALKTIATGYQTPQQIKRNCEKDYGLSYEETLEMAYENIQQIAKEASKGVRSLKGKVELITTPAKNTIYKGTNLID